MFRPTSSLTDCEIAWLRGLLRPRPMFRLYFEAALEALAEGLDNRSYLLGEARRGMAFSMAFDAVTVRTTVGELCGGELREVAEVPGRAELHVEPEHLEAVREACGARIEVVKTLRYYRLCGRPSGDPDPRCRLLGEADFEAAARLFREHYPGTVFSSWMLALPFIGLFEDGELAACGGVHALDRGLGACILGNFLTQPARRGRGLAQAVARTLVLRLIELGYPDCLLGAAAENPAACRAYEAVGFRVLEERPQIELRR